MGKCMNRVELKGNVGMDPTINQFQEGAKVMRLSLATNEKYKTRKGELMEETVWHNIVAWAGKYMPDFEQIKKGDFLQVIGRLKPTKYTTKTGVEKQSYEIVASSIKVGDIQGG